MKGAERPNHMLGTGGEGSGAQELPSGLQGLIQSPGSWAECIILSRVPTITLSVRVLYPLNSWNLLAAFKQLIPPSTAPAILGIRGHPHDHCLRQSPGLHDVASLSTAEGVGLKRVDASGREGFSKD